MIAKVIVDVPLMQTDKPYSYQIPSEFEDMVEAGMRVHVPFGKGNPPHSRDCGRRCRRGRYKRGIEGDWRGIETTLQS